MKKISFRVPKKEYGELEERAKESNKTVSAYIRDIVNSAGGDDRLYEKITRIEKNLRRIYFAAERGNVAVEELSKRSLEKYSKYIADIEKRMTEMKKGGK